MITVDSVEIPRMLMTRERLAWLNRAGLKIVIPLFVVSIWLLFNLFSTSGVSPASTANIILEFLRLACLLFWGYSTTINRRYGYKKVYVAEEVISIAAIFAALSMTALATIDFVCNFLYHAENIASNLLVRVMLLATVVSVATIASIICQTLPLACLDYQNWQTYNSRTSIKKTFLELYQIAPQ